MKNFANFKITDKDEIYEKSDKITIKGISVEGTKFTMFFSGMTYQPEEKYLLEMNGIKDENGNSTSPEKKVITLVQRVEVKENKTATNDAATADIEPATEPEKLPRTETNPLIDQ